MFALLDLTVILPQRVPNVYKKRPRKYFRGLYESLHQAQGQGQQDPSQSDPLSSGSQLLIQSRALILAQIGISTAGDGTGQASLLTGLQQNDHNQADAGDDLQDSQNNLHNLHFINLPPPKTANRMSLSKEKLCRYSRFILSQHDKNCKNFFTFAPNFLLRGNSGSSQ